MDLSQRELQLQLLLESLTDQVENPSQRLQKVYFQPTSNVGLVYPCITYERSRATTKFAGNLPYIRVKRYTVTVIDPDVDSIIPDLVGKLPMCTHSTFFVADQLNHDVFDLFF